MYMFLCTLTRIKDLGFAKSQGKLQHLEEIRSCVLAFGLYGDQFNISVIFRI